MTIDRESLQELFATHDPEGLLAAGAPADEYDPEMEQLTAALAALPPGDTTHALILNHLNAIWHKDFAATDAHLARCRPAFDSIAAKLLEHYI